MSSHGSVPERRVFRRVDLSSPVELLIPGDGSSPEERRLAADGEMVNIGCGGVLVRVDRWVDEGTRCRVRILDPNRVSLPDEAEGVVRRARRSAGATYLGIEFAGRVDALRLVKNGVPSEEALKLEPLRVLVADDEAGIRELLQRFLSQRGCTVETASDGESALAAMRHDRIDAVFLDLRMPILGGLEVLSRVRDEQLSVGPIWAVSAYASDQEACEAMRLGAADFINKPFDLRYLEWSLHLSCCL